MNQQNREFTLIELMIVIAIILILAALLLPAFNKAREKGQAIKCLGNLKQMGQAVSMYTTDFDDYLLTVQMYTLPSGTRNYSVWYCRDGIGQYLNYPGGFNAGSCSHSWQNKVYDCPTNFYNSGPFPASGSGTTNYGFNNAAEGLGGDSGTVLPYLKSNMAAPDTFVIGDTGPVSNNTRGSMYLGFGEWSKYGLWGYYPWHSGGANFVHLGGNAGHYKTTDLYIMKTESIEPKITRAKD